MSSDSSFLGTGWSFPPSFAAAGSDVRMVSAAEDIEQSLAILLTTRRGERVLQDDFGCDLSEFQFAEVSQGLSRPHTQLHCGRIAASRVADHAERRRRFAERRPGGAAA
jgi:hypothetical protein